MIITIFGPVINGLPMAVRNYEIYVHAFTGNFTDRIFQGPKAILIFLIGKFDRSMKLAQQLLLKLLKATLQIRK